VGPLNLNYAKECFDSDEPRSNRCREAPVDLDRVDRDLKRSKTRKATLFGGSSRIAESNSKLYIVS
jgi:hypothetical protein